MVPKTIAFATGNKKKLEEVRGIVKNTVQLIVFMVPSNFTCNLRPSFHAV